LISQLFELLVDDADVLGTAGSQLRRAPDDGQYEIWAHSDQSDGLLSINSAGLAVYEESEMPQGTVGQIDTGKEPVAKFIVGKGDDVIMNYNEVTAGTATVKVRFMDLIDLMTEQGYSLVEIGELVGE